MSGKSPDSFLTASAYINGGSTMGTISPNPIVDSEISAENDFVNFALFFYSNIPK